MTTAIAERRPEPKAFRCLVLNSNFMPLSTWPLSVVPSQEAVSAVWRDRANVVETWGDAFYRSPSTKIPVPRVIALRNYVHIETTPKFCRRSIFLRDRFCCQYCGRQFAAEDLTFDHVVPRANGGHTVWDNILTCCVPCNADKRDHPADYSGRKGSRHRPMKVPRCPTTFELLRAGLDFLAPDLRDDFGSWLYWNAEIQP
jgi:5-methylcytosine-specific restriction endonuclease McrA